MVNFCFLFSYFIVKQIINRYPSLSEYTFATRFLDLTFEEAKIITEFYEDLKQNTARLVNEKLTILEKLEEKIQLGLFFCIVFFFYMKFTFFFFFFFLLFYKNRNG